MEPVPDEPLTPRLPENSPLREPTAANFAFAPPPPRVDDTVTSRLATRHAAAPRQTRATRTPETQPAPRFSDPRRPLRAAVGLAAIVVVGSIALAAAVGAAIVVISLAASAAAG